MSTLPALNIGNQLNHIVNNAKGAFFHQSELAQLTFDALQGAAKYHHDSNEDTITIHYPVGWTPERQPIPGFWAYTKTELLERYEFLSRRQLAINGLFQLVAINESMIGDIVRAVVLRYPQKAGAKRQISLHTVLESRSIEELHRHAADSVLNELLYKSPSDLAESLQKIISVNLMECSAYHRYIEIKATRDIYIHNSGIANDTYVSKSSTHSRVASGYPLPLDIIYFFESFEACLQLNEWLEKKLHEHWFSSVFADRNATQDKKPESPPYMPVQPAG